MRTSKKKNTRDRFNFKDIVIVYDDDPRWKLLHVYYLSKDNKYNKEIDGIIKDMGYTRNRLVRSYPLLEVAEGFEYEWMGIYISNEHMEELSADRIRREKIRECVLSNIK